MIRFLIISLLKRSGGEDKKERTTIKANFGEIKLIVNCKEAVM